MALLAVWVGGQVSFAQAEAILRESGQVQISDSSIWRAVEQWGGALQGIEAQAVAAANALPSREQPPAGESKHTQRMGFSLDGWTVHLRGEGWKEVKTGVIYHIEQHEGANSRLLKCTQEFANHCRDGAKVIHFSPVTCKFS